MGSQSRLEALDNDSAYELYTTQYNTNIPHIHTFTLAHCHTLSHILIILAFHSSFGFWNRSLIFSLQICWSWCFLSNVCLSTFWQWNGSIPRVHTVSCWSHHSRLRQFIPFTSQVNSHSLFSDYHFQQKIRILICLFFRIEKDRIERISIKLQQSSEEEWTKALKYLLTNVKAILCWVVQNEHKEIIMKS